MGLFFACAASARCDIAVEEEPELGVSLSLRTAIFPASLSGSLALTFGIGILGGSSRGGVALNLFAQLLACGLALVAVTSSGRPPLRSEGRFWLWLVALLTLWMALQLVPLPPAFWTNLPGRGIFVREAAAIGVAQPWRPISLSPMNTWLALVGMIIPIALILSWGRGDPRQLFAGRWLLLGLAAFSVMLGILQISGGAGSDFYFFNSEVRGYPAGLFSNRNHQAAMLAMVFPLLGAGVVEARITGRRETTAVAGACLAASIVMPVLLLTGSRAGLLLAGISIALTCVMIATFRLSDARRASARRRLVFAAIAAIPLAIGGLSLALGRAAAIERLTRLRLNDDQRLSQLPTVLDMVRGHFPMGAGYGTFAPVFRVYEPFENLQFSYYNHAHNDWIEQVFEGGLPAIMLALAALARLAQTARQAWASPDRSCQTLYARAGSIIIVTLMIASAADYPLRSPTIQVFAAISLAWLWANSSGSGPAALKTHRVPLLG